MMNAETVVVPWVVTAINEDDQSITVEIATNGNAELNWDALEADEPLIVENKEH